MRPGPQSPPREARSIGEHQACGKHLKPWVAVRDPLKAACALLALLLATPPLPAQPPQAGRADPPRNHTWPADWERQYQQRVRQVLDVWKTKKHGGTTFGESEKALYPSAMFLFLNGRTNEAIKLLQEEDNQAKVDHAHTLGLDFYWCFTLKGQVRKYFYFGPWLTPAYRQRMFDAAKIWTEQDPLRREHPRHGKGDPKNGVWGPENKGSWVDVRNTDNLRAMRDVAVYLFAEETGNEATRRLYKQRLTEYVQTLHHIGMSEWDSPNYHGHGLSTYVNLHDFARDPEVKALAKAALDWMLAAAALKYRPGAMGGPNSRDYGGHVVFEQGASHVLWLYFGNTPQPDPDPDRDLVHHITSSYRPPRALVELARKNFSKPVELLATHPPYRNWKPGEPAAPEFFETQYIGETFQLGTCTSLSTGGLWNINAFTLVADNSQRGVDFFCANTESALGHSWKRPGDQVAQFRNLVLWLRPARKATEFHFQLPRTAKTEAGDGVWFIALEKTWLALKPIALTEPKERPWAELAGLPKGNEPARPPRGADTERIFTAATTGDSYAGFALEVGEAPRASFDEFKRAVLAGSRLGLVHLKDGQVQLTASDGGKLRLAHNGNDELPIVERNGEPVDWSTWRACYSTGSVGTAPIQQDWLDGELRVSAGGWTFTSRVGAAGKATYVEKPQ